MISRVRKDSSHQTLSQESYSFDRRGNMISYTDGEGKTITGEYDQLNRLKTQFAPSDTPQAAQERTHISYGRNTLLIINNLGEKQIFTKDALNRITSVVNEDANNQKVSETTYAYSPEKNSVTATKGSESTTILFDNLGNPVLVKQSDSEGGFWTQLWNATLGNPRVQGGLMFAGGVLEMIGGAVLFAVPAPPTKVGGGALIGHGADMVATGLKQLWSGQATETFTAQGVSKGLQSVGTPPHYAGMVGGLTEFGLAVGPIGIVGKVGAVGQSRKALLAAAYGTPRAESSLSAQLLRHDLLTQEASSAFTASGKLSKGALAGSREIMKAESLGNPNIPAGFSKWRTNTFQSPSGNFQVHFYRNPVTSEVHYGLDYKVKFNSASEPLWPGPK